MTDTIEGMRPNVTDEELLRGPTKASIAGDGVTLPLAGGASRKLRFSVRNIVRVELTYRSHANFLIELQTMPLSVLAWLLVNCCEQPLDGVDDALPLLEGVDWRPLQKSVRDAWEASMPAESGADVGPTGGS